MRERLKWALGIYLALALTAAFTLDGKMRLFIWILLGAMAIKTWVASRQSN